MIIQGVITKQWQIYLSEKVRERLGLKRPTKVLIKVEKGGVFIKPVKSKFLQLAGILAGKRPKKKINLDKIREYIDYSEI